MSTKDSIREFAREELSKHGIPEREDLYDPETGRTIPQVFTGVMPFYREAQIGALKSKSRSTGGYTSEGTPQRGGESGSKHLGCFIGDTEILLENGDFKSIEKVVENRLYEEIQSLNLESGTKEKDTVVDWYKYTACPDDILHVKVKKVSSGFSKLVYFNVTKDHFFYTEDGSKLKTRHMRPGDKLKTHTGETAVVISLKRYVHPERKPFFPVYDITVKNNSNYFVNGICVSNSGEYKAIKSHGADAVLSDLKLIHSARNTDFWNTVKAGLTPSVPDTPEVYKKFRALIRAAGVNLREDREGDHIYAMTNQQARDITGNRKIEKPSTIDLKMRPIRKGLNDPQLTEGKFGYIELPEPLPNPLMEPALRKILDVRQQDFDALISGEGKVSLKEALDKINIDKEMEKAKQNIRHKSRDKRDKAYKKYTYLHAMKDQGVHPSDFLMERVPVLPHEWRPISKMKDTHLIADPNRLYRDLMFKIQDYKDVAEQAPELLPEARKSVFDAYRAAIGTAQTKSPKLQEQNVRGILSQFLGKGSPKLSMVQRRVIGSDLDLYGLGVIVPDPRLSLDEAGIPEEQAWKVYEPLTIRNLVKKGTVPRKATEEVEKRTPRARKALEEEVNSRPAILNRAPTLYKYGIQAFDGKLVPGHAIHVNPYVCPGYGADFDGDTMSLTIPITEEAVKDARNKMYPSKNLLDPKGEPAYKPDNEMIQGLYYLTKEPSEDAPVLNTSVSEASQFAKEAYNKQRVDIDTPVVGTE